MRIRRRKRYTLRKLIFLTAFVFVISKFWQARYGIGSLNQSGIYDTLSSYNPFRDRAYKTDNMAILRKNITMASQNDDKAGWVLDNFDNLDKSLIYLAGNDKDTIPFVYNYSKGIIDFAPYPGQSLDLARSTPYFLQWDNRWAYQDLGDSVIGLAGCGPTSMAMVLARLRGDISIDPSLIATDARGYMTRDGISWSFFDDEASKYGYSIADISHDEASLIAALDSGPLIVSVNRGIFTLFGHILVIDSYQDGKFIINDPNSIEKSQRPWSYEQIADQLAHVWQVY